MPDAAENTVDGERMGEKTLAELRALIEEGLNSGEDEPWDVEEIKRLARDRR